jgi:hypothetical protein
VHGEFIGNDADLVGFIDYRSTRGGVDNADASEISLGAHGSLLLGNDPLVPRSRANGGIEYVAGSYSLYGLVDSIVGRTRADLLVTTRLASQDEEPLGYALSLDLGYTSVTDRAHDSTNEYSSSGLSPALALELRAPLDLIAKSLDSVHGRLRVNYSSTSLSYSRSTRSPAFIAARAEAEWQMTPKLRLTAGLIGGSGGSSDTDAFGLFMPTLVARYDAGDGLSFVGAFVPDLRPPSVRTAFMTAPYIDREPTLRPERMPVALHAGARYAVEGLNLDATLVYESIDNVGVVVAGTRSGSLRWEHTDASSIGVRSSASVDVGTSVTLSSHLDVMSTVFGPSSTALPMHPLVRLQARCDVAATDELTVWGSGDYESSKRISLDPTDQTELSARVLFGVGASYKLPRNIEAFVEGSNLANSVYELWRGYRAPGIEGRIGARIVL